MSTVHDIADRHPRGRFLAVQTVAWLLVAVALYDGGGFAFGGDAVTSSPSYAALRMVPGGMRAWGVALLVGAACVSWGLRRGTPYQLQWMFAGGVAYYLAWSATIPATWWRLGAVPAWGGESKVLLLAALYYLCGRAVAPPKHHRKGDRGPAR